MKSTPSIFRILIIPLVLLQGCGMQKQSSQEEDIEAIKELQATYKNAVSNGDLDLFMSLWEDEAIRMVSDLNYIVGKENIKEHFRVYFEQFQVGVTLYGDYVIQVFGNVAFSHSNITISFTPVGGDATTYTDFKYLEIYKKQQDGSWKIHIGNVTTNPTLTDQNHSPNQMKNQDKSAPKL
ncbi:MAG: hypothetical protein DRI70_08030 [Bacteroidetes bacterium]|nr:MAG: hypothetical protein DRI70_08030 [Bacteroidota bacterium]